ncbi:MAG: PAS domain-containing protein [Alphaproteobacteria bacterium]
MLRTDADFAAIDPRYRLLYDLLQAKAPPGRLPGRRHFDPVEVPRLLSCLNLVEVLRDEVDLHFRYRLHGTRQTDLAGRDITGLTVEEAVNPPFIERINGNMRLTCQSRRPVYDRFPMPHPERESIDSERVYYPLAADGETVDMLLILNGYPGSPGG